MRYRGLCNKMPCLFSLYSFEALEKRNHVPPKCSKCMTTDRRRLAPLSGTSRREKDGSESNGASNRVCERSSPRLLPLTNLPAQRVVGGEEALHERLGIAWVAFSVLAAAAATVLPCVVLPALSTLGTRQHG